MDERGVATRKLYKELMRLRFEFMPAGVYALQQIYAAVRVRYEELCNDSFLCKEVCTEGKNHPEWWHTTRRALTQLSRKYKHQVRKGSRHGYWVLGQPGRLYPNEVDPGRMYREGAVYQVTVNAYERDPKARSACIEYYGPTCVVCGFRFGAVYGTLAEGFIHVHHVRPLSEIGEEYEVDPIEDLRPVCANDDVQYLSHFVKRQPLGRPTVE
jgi:hypothetical protein